MKVSNNKPSNPYEQNRIINNIYFEFKNLWGCRPTPPPPRTQITWASSLGLEEPSLKSLHSVKLQHMNSTPTSNYRHTKSAVIFFRNYNINSLLWLYNLKWALIQIYIIYIERYILEEEMKKYR